MNQYIYTSSAARPAISDSLFPLATGRRPGDRAQSLSGSDDGSFGAHKHENGVEGVCHFLNEYRRCTHHRSEDVTLTSQTLNADGTPKRPMNAFMVFARRRRPQVSAENQSMRTGEISKLLSKEWTTMPMSEKQFYLDQAKILKENFNSKYPDYVYRRRPNNTRKKKRGDIAGLRQLDNPQSDKMAGHDLEGLSHTDEGLDSTGHCARVPHDMAQAYESRYGSISSRYSISSDGFGPPSTQDTHVSYSTSSHRTPQELAPCRLGQPNHTSYSYPYQTPNPATPLYDPLNSAESWQQHRAGRGCSWPSASHGSDRMISIDNSKMDPYPPSSPPHTSLSSSGSTNTNGNVANPYQFQVLTTAFNPNQNAVTGYSSSPSPVPANHQYEVPPHGGREYAARPYAPSPVSPTSYSSNREISYPQPHPISRNVTLSDVSSLNHPGIQSSETNSHHGYGQGSRFF